MLDQLLTEVVLPVGTTSLRLVMLSTPPKKKTSMCTSVCIYIYIYIIYILK